MSLNLWRSLGYALLGLIIVACLVPMPELPGPDMPLRDKWMHLVAWGSLAAWFGQISGSAGERIRSVAGLFAISGLIEVVQIMVPFRDGDWGDLIANAIGLASGMLLSAIFRLPAAILSRDS